MRPNHGDYAPFYETYVKLVQEENIQDAFRDSLDRIRELLGRIPAEKADYAYADGKWTVKQLLQHLIDTERIFAYRAVCVARGEQQALPGFDENSYAAQAEVSHRSVHELTEELLTLRNSVIMMYRGFTPSMLAQKGTASGKPVTANALGYIMIGHIMHHASILKDRYGIS